MFDQIFLSPQVKRSMTISNRHGIYKLPYEFLIDLKLYMLGKQEVSGKSQSILICYIGSTTVKDVSYAKNNSVNIPYY